MNNRHLKAIAMTMLLAMPLSASAQELLISGGSRGGSYEKWATRLALQMSGLGHASKSLPSGGSKENLARVKTGEAAVGFTQADTLMDEGPEGIEIIGPLAKGCVFVAVFEDGKVDDEDDLQDEGHTIAVGAKGSGSQSTWSYMTKLEPAYANSAADYAGGNRALGKLKTGNLDAVMWVTDPENKNHKMYKTVTADAQLDFIDIDDSDLNDKLPNGQPVYTFEDIDTPGFGGIETICTEELVIASPALPEDVLEALAEIVLANRASITK